MKVEIHIALKNELCPNKQLENTLTYYTISDISTQIFVLLSV